MGARVSNCDCMPYNLNPLNRRPGHTHTHLDHKERLGGLRPVLTKVAAECRVGRDFVGIIEHEFMENEQVLAPEEI
jgi:hypothetical protein